MSAPSCPPIACPLQRARHSHLCRAAPARTPAQAVQGSAGSLRGMPHVPRFRGAAQSECPESRRRARSQYKPASTAARAGGASGSAAGGHAALQAPEARRARRSGHADCRVRRRTASDGRNRAQPPAGAAAACGRRSKGVDGRCRPRRPRQGCGGRVRRGAAGAACAGRAQAWPVPARSRQQLRPDARPRRRDPVEGARGRRKTKKSSRASCLRTAI